MKVKGTFEFFLNDDGKHASLVLKFNEPVEDWLRFAYCNDLVWRIHGMGGGEAWMSMIDIELYKKLFHHIHGDQYLVPGAES
jgi:hypothetical protein